MARSYLHGKLVDHIDFDSSCPFTMTGGNGDIYRGSHILEVHPDGSPRRFYYVALKSMRCGTDDVDNRLVKIIDEAAVWKNLHHPHILRFLGLLNDVRGTYLVAPFAPHGSLPQYLLHNPEADRPTFLAHTASGLAYLHEQGVVHGDVKGANILVFDGPSARICDFGLAKRADPNPGTTQNNVGSLYWMSPERLLDQTRTRESDVYAFGLTIYEILSGLIPFAGLTFVAVFGAVHSREERPPMEPQSSTTGVSYAQLWALAARCWNQLPSERPPMKRVFDAIVASIGDYVEANYDDILIIAVPSPPASATHKRKRTDILHESGATSDPNVRAEDASGLEADATQKVAPSRRPKRLKASAQMDRLPTNDLVETGIDMIGQRVQTIQEAIHMDVVAEYPSAVLPARPDALFGREIYVENLVERLCYLPSGEEEVRPTPNPPRLAILGPGGIGKTTVALAAVNDYRLKALYEDRLHWVPCEEATTPELLIELIARSMGVIQSKGADRKRDIINFLRPSTRPRLLLLDNFETPWDIPTKQTEVNNIIHDIASVSPLTILLTMRSDAPPPTRIRWTKPTLPPLASLLPEAAREMYLDIHEDAGEDPGLADLLDELAHLPLAVRLMATRGSLGEMPSRLLSLWRDERVRAKLLHQGDDRITSVTVSVELSINSHLMRANPDALSLLSVLAELPGGARQAFIQSIAPSIVDCGGALGTLRRAALVQINPSTQHIHLLSPIRSLVLDNHRAPGELLNAMRDAYFCLIHEYDSQPGNKLFPEAAPLLTLETINIESVLMDAMNVEPSNACIEAAYAYAEFQYLTIPRAEIIEKAVTAVQSVEDNYDIGMLPRGLHLMARLYWMMDRYEDASDAAQRALPIYRRLGDQRGEANCLQSLAVVHRSMGQYENALDAVQRALPISQRIGDQCGEANCLRSLASVYQSMDRYKDALDAVQKALPISQRIGDQHGEASDLQSLADVYQSMDRYEDALDAAQRALPISQRIADQLCEANCLQTLADVYQLMDRYEDALDAAQRALPIFQRIGDQLGEANCLRSLADVYQSMGQYEDALDAAQKAFPISQRIGDQHGEANCLRRLASVYQSMDRYEDALDAVQKALPISQRIGDQHGEASDLQSLADVYQSMGRYEDALDAVQKALPISQRIGDQHGEASRLRRLASVYRMMGRYEDALDAVQKALPISQRIGDQFGEASCLRRLASVYQSMDRYEDALDAAQRALPISQRIGDQRGEANCLRSLASVYRSMGQYEDALDAAQRALPISQRIADQHGEASCLWNLAQTYGQLHRTEEGLRAVQGAIEIFLRLGRDKDVQSCQKLRHELGANLS